MVDRIVNCKDLKKCKLWSGSMEELSFTYGGLRTSEVEAKIRSLEACDNLTANEVEYLRALKEAVGR